MDAAPKISVEVDDRFAEVIGEAVASGDYADAKDVVEHALSRWQENRRAEIARLQRLWEEGVASGTPQPVPDDWADKIIEAGERRLAMKAAGEAA